MTRYTSPDNLPIPDDYQSPADSPAALGALGDAVQAALSGLRAIAIQAGAGLTGGGNLSATRTLSVDYGTLDDRYQFKSQFYAYMSSEGATVIGDKTISAHLWTVGDLAPGEEKTKTVQVSKGSYVFVSVQHHSTYIFAVANLTTGTTTDSCEMKVRNSTTQTTHTNVKVHLLVVNP